MADVKIPTVGRQVHYFPNGADDHASANGAYVLPATVVQESGLLLNLAVTTMNPDGIVVLRYSIAHKSLQIGEDGDAAGRYWDWPEIK